MRCNPCDGTGWKNTHQIESDKEMSFEEIERWVAERNRIRGDSCQCGRISHGAPCSYCELAHDVCRCDCCMGCQVPGEHGICDNQVFDCM